MHGASRSTASRPSGATLMARISPLSPTLLDPERPGRGPDGAGPVVPNPGHTLHWRHVQLIHTLVHRTCGRYPLKRRKESHVRLTADFTHDIDSHIVARYFIAQDAARQDPDVTHMKLQKLLYFAQAQFLASTGFRLMDKPIEAFDHGPVVYDEWTEFNRHGRKIIADENVEVFDRAELQDDIEAFLNQVWGKYKDYSATQLRRKTHREDPWKRFYDRSYRRVIPDDAMISYYREKVPSSERIYHPSVVVADASFVDSLIEDEDAIVAQALAALRG